MTSERTRTPSLTEAAFAQTCAFIAARAAGMANHSLTWPDNHERQINPATVARFTDELRGSLNRLDERAGRAPIEPSPSTLEALERLSKEVAVFDEDVAAELSVGLERADLWTEIDVSVEDLRTVLTAVRSLSGGKQ